MKERPILFNGEMVRAILDGRKTQTRRVVKPLIGATGVNGIYYRPDGCYIGLHLPVGAGVGITQPFPCPLGSIGSHLYVKETFLAWGRWETRYSEKKGRDEWHFVDMTHDCGREYRFDDIHLSASPRTITPAWHKRPSIFMPRIASRITLEITGVRVERLQDISEEDAEAEGVEVIDHNCYRNYSKSADAHFLENPTASFRSLWQSINGAESWDANPWVWAITFKKVAA